MKTVLKRGINGLSLRVNLESYSRMENYHVPVLAQESVELLNIRKDGVYVDLTFGGGGHTRLILSQLGKNGRLFSFDQDADAIANVPQDERFTFIESNFSFMRGQLRTLGITRVDGVLADLGVSSHHFDTRERGFSFRFEAPLDMRMNQRGKLTAASVVNGYPAEELTRILGEYGEVETPYKAANCIVRARDVGTIETIGELMEAVAPCTPKKDPNKFYSKLFQGIRIEVNREMEALRMALEQSFKVLNPGGRLVVISYHSLEDRLVKNFLRSGNFEGRLDKDFYGRVQAPFEVITRKALVPGAEELSRNPRSRSAKLRAGEKILQP